MSTPLRLMAVTKKGADYSWWANELSRTGLDPFFEFVFSEQEFREMFAKQFDGIVLDYAAPAISISTVVRLLEESASDIPLFVVSKEPIQDRLPDRITQQFSGVQITAFGRSVARIIEADRQREKNLALRKKILSLENELRRIEERKSFILEFNPVGIVLTKPDGKIIECNPPFARMFGYSSPEEVLKLSILDFYQEPDSRGALLLQLQQCTNVINFEMLMRRKDGSPIWIMNNAQLLATEEHGIVIYGCVIDVTDQKRIESALRESEERYRLLFDSNPHPMWVFARESLQFLAVNDAAIRKYGYDRKEFLAMTIKDIRPTEDVQRLQSFVSNLNESVSKPSLWRHRIKDGSLIDVEVTGHDFWLGAIPARLVLVLDVTQRIRDENEILFRDRALQGVSQGIVITDCNLPDNPIVYVNPGFERLSGYSRDEIIGRNCRFLQGPDTDRSAIDEIREAIANDRGFVGEILNYRKDGSRFWNALSISPVVDANKTITHYIGVQVDVTERRSLEDQYRQAQKMEAVGRLAGGVAHDFNNLLTVINGYSELLLGNLPIGDFVRELVKEIKGAGERAASLTRQLLAFSRQQVLTPQILDLNASLADLEKMLRRLIGEDIELKTDKDPMLGAIKADPGQMEQVILNLVVNARDAMPQGGILRLETRNVEVPIGQVRRHVGIQSGPYIRLTVSDSGHGMDEPTRAKIFEPFFTTKGSKGTGLGLATVYGIVKQSGGFVEVVSSPGEGASFHIYLPHTPESVIGSKSNSGLSKVAIGNETILVVEDEEGVRALLRKVLQSSGYTVLEAQGGEEALAICEQQSGPIQLLLTDVVMPRMSGRELADKIVRIRPNIKVLYLSGYTDDAVVRHGVTHETVNFLQKPFTTARLANKVREVLDSWDQRALR